MHTCNPFCQGGVHAVLVDPSPNELAAAPPALAKILGVVASSAGLRYIGHNDVRNEPVLGPPGQPTAFGATRGRVIVWGIRPGEQAPK